MRILWTSNIMFPEAKAILSGGRTGLNSSGGWLTSLAGEIASKESVKLYVACTCTEVECLTRIEGERITYFIIPGGEKSGEPLKNDDGSLDRHFRKIINEVKPDVVDIHGTEYAHSASCIRFSNPERTVTTIQGLLCECGKHYYDGLSIKEIKSCSKIFGRTVIDEAKEFLHRAEIEKFIIQRSGHIIGRTLWDKSHSLEINPHANYHHCDEILRGDFYEGTWTYGGCRPHSIFLSQSSYPIKGLHRLIDALPMILAAYPDTKVLIGGDNIIQGRYADLTNYGKIIRKRLERLHLEEVIDFIGPLDSARMKAAYLASNVFVMPSTIENSSNSLGEAQMLGVPCVAACVGGTGDMIPSRECGILYPSHDTTMLAGAICKIFSTENFDNNTMRAVAHRRHDREANGKRLMEIYTSICNG